MAAGLGFKTFTTGEVLTAADTNGYLMQGINVFASTAARDAAITSPQEGQFAFTKDTNGLWYYDGAAWVASGATGDIEGVTAGIGISGGGTSGTVTVTNSMATAIDAKGDLIAGTGADAFSRLVVGANNTVLTADSAEATGLKWATASAGALTLITSATFSGSTAISVNSCFSATYTNYLICIQTTSGSTNTLTWKWRVGGVDSSASYYWGYSKLPLGVATPTYTLLGAAGAQTSASMQQFDTNSIMTMTVSKVNTTSRTVANWQMATDQASGHSSYGGIFHAVNTAYDGFTFTNDLAPTGKYWVYGYGN